jgi:hypothetical protein
MFRIVVFSKQPFSTACRAASVFDRAMFAADMLWYSPRECAEYKMQICDTREEKTGASQRYRSRISHTI